jgi:hypothetical protein
MRKKSRTLACRLSMSLTTKTPEHIGPAYNLPRGRAVGRGKVAEAAQTAEAEAPHAAQAAQAVEGRMVCREGCCARSFSAVSALAQTVEN